MSERPSRSEDTLEQGALHADVLTRMFGEAQPELLKTVGRYQILRKLGAGGMGEVYLGHDPELDRKIAIKLLRRHDDGGFTEGATRRIREEARAMARVSHAHVVHVHDVGRYRDRLFLAMEYVEGTTLTRWLEQDRSWKEILRVFIEAGEGLVAAHDAELVHRDFKPDNVLIGSDGEVKVTDFGIAVVMDSWQTQASINDALTERGHDVAGTLRYMSPEQVRGHSLDARSDQFSFCVALVEALTGQHPFAHHDRGELIRGLLSGERRPPARGHATPAWVMATLERGIGLRPSERWPTMRALLDALADDPAVRRRNLRLTGMVALGVGLTAFVAGRGVPHDPDDPCTEGAQSIEQAWSDDRRAAIAEQFSTWEYGEGSLDAIVSSLDGWSSRWSDAYGQLCRSRHERSNDRYELRMACLTEQRQRVEARVELLTYADAALVSEAPRLLEGLPEPSECIEDSLELAPAEPELAAEIAEIRKHLASVEARLSFKTPELVLDELEQLQRRADAVDYRPLQAELAWVRSLEAGLRHDGDRERELLALAYGLGLETRHDRIALQAAVGMLRRDVPNEASPEAEHVRELWNATAGHLSARLGFPLEQELRRRNLYIDYLRTHGRRQRVQDAIDESLALLERTVGLDHPLAIDTLTDVAYGHLQRNELSAALETLDHVESIFETWLGSDHPLVTQPLQTRSDALFMMGRYDEALAVAQRALRLQVAAHGPDNVLAMTTLERIATIQDLLGHHAEARDAYQELLGGPFPRAEDLDSNLVAVANSLCFVHYRLGEHDEATKVCEQTLLGARRMWPEGSAMEAVILNNLALVARAQGRLEDGLAIDREALSLCESLDPPELRATVYSWIGVGESLLALGRPGEAIEPLEQALEVRSTEAPGSPEHGEAECLLARARVGAAPEQRDAALGMARQGLQRLMKAGPGWEQAIDECRSWLEDAGNLDDEK